MNEFDRLLYKVGGDPYNTQENDNGQSEEMSSESSGGLLDGIVQDIKKALTPTAIAPNWQPRPLGDSVYTDTPGAPTEGAFGALEDEGVRQERMDNYAQWAADNIPHAYAGMIGGVEGLANVVGGIRNAAGGEDSDWILRNAEKAEKSIANIRRNWDDQYGDSSYIFNPNGLANDIGNGIGSSLPIMGLSLLAPEAAVGLGTRAATSALSRMGLGRLAASKAGQALIGDVMRSPLSTAGDTMAEYGSIVYDLKQSGMSDEEAREKAKAIIPRNIALDTLTIPGELYIMKGAKGIGGRRILSTSDDSLRKRIAKGAARAGLLSPASAITEGYQEGAQNALEDNVKGERDTNWFNPFSWNDEDLKAARAGAVGAAFMGAPGNFMKGFSKTLQPINKSESWGNGGLDIAEEQTNPVADNPNGMMDFSGTGTTTGVFSPQEIVDGVASRNAETLPADLNNSSALFADDATETGVKSPADIIAGVQQRTAHAAESSGSSQNVFGTAAGTTTGISSPDEIIAGVQQRQQKAADVEQQKNVISQYLDDNTVDQMGGEDNYNWLMGVIRSGTPEEVQQAYDTVVASTAETRRQEEAANARQAAASRSAASADTVVRTGNSNVDAVIQAANDQHFDANVALAVAAVESGGGDVNEIHMAGHDGMFQIEPETAQNYGVADKYPNWQTDPYENAMAGIEVLKAKIAEKGGDLWSGVEHYNGGGDADYLAKVQAAYETTGNAGSTASSGSGAVYDGIRLTLPDSDAFTDESGNVDGLTEDTRMKLRVLDNLCYQKFGQHLIVSSSYREGDSGNHGAGVAFDVSGGIADDPEARQWLEQAGPAVGLFVIPEYQGEAGAEFAHGDNVHFSNVEPGIYGQTRDAEGHWSEEHAAPSIQSILNGSNGHASSSIDLNTNLESNAFENALHQWEDVTIPDTAEALKNTASEGKDADLFDTMFTVDDTGKEHFQDTKENREAVKQQYGRQVRDAAITAMVKHLLQEPSVQQNTTITKQLSQAVKKGDTTAMTQIARQWFDMKTPNLERERSQAGMVRPMSQPIGGMPYETSRRTSQNQTNGTEAVPNQNVNTVPGQSQEAGTFRENSGSPAAPNETNVTAEAVRNRASIEQPIIGHTSLVPRDDSITAVKNHTAPAMLSEQIRTVLPNGADSVQPQTVTAGDTRNTQTIFADTMQQGRPVIYKGEVAEEDGNTEAVKKLQDTLYHKGEAVFNVDDFEAEKQKRGPQYTMQDYAKEWLARKAPGVKRDTAAYQALEKTVAQHMEAAYNLTQNGIKKAADNGGVKLADGYRTESGRPLSEADKDEFIVKPNGSRDFGIISKTIEEATHGELKVGEIRLKVGDDKQGLIHAKAHEEAARKIGYRSIEDLIADVSAHFDAIYRRDNGAGKRASYILVKYKSDTNSRNLSAPVYFSIEKNEKSYYIIITAIPKNDRGLRREIKKEHLIYSSAGIDATTAPNNSSVSAPASNKVGAGQDGRLTSVKSNVPSSSIIAKEAEKGNTDDGLRMQLSEEEKQVYDYAVQKLSQGNDKLAKEAEETPRALQDIKDEIQDALPNAKSITEDGNRLILTMPNGSQFVVDIQNQIALTAEQLAQAKKDHHIHGDVVVEGYTRQFGKDAYMALAQGSRTGTGYHEVYHAAEDAVLTDKEKAAITKAIPDAEKRADQYAKWVEARKRGRGTAWGKLFQKIKDFAKKVQAILTRTENAHHVFRKVESGEVWTRERKDSQSANAKLAKTARQKLKEDAQRFSKSVDDFMNGKKMPRNIKVMTTPLVMNLIGEKLLPIYISPSVMEKILKTKHSKEISPEILKKLPKALTDPLMILRDIDNKDIEDKNKKLVVVDMKDNNGATIMVPFIMDVKANRYELANVIESVYGRTKDRISYVPNDKWYIKRLKRGDAVYANKKRIDHWLKTLSLAGAQNGSLVVDSFNLSTIIPDETDLGKLKRENPTRYSIRKPKTASEKETERNEKKDNEPITIHMILNEARKIVPIYTRSKVQRSSRAAYRYDAHGRAGFVPSNYTVGDIGAAVALHIDHAAQLKGANVELTNDVLDELETEQRAAKKYKQEPPKAMTPAEARREGVKEFGRIYFQNPDRAKERYPKYFDIFEKTLDTMPKEKKAVENIMELEEQMAAQNPLLLATAGISQAADKKPRNAKERLNHAWAQFYRAMVDETSPIDQITKSIEMELGRKLADEKDPHKRAVMCNSVADGRASMLLFADNKDANLAYLNTVYKGAIQYKVTFEDVLNELKKVRQDDVVKAAAKDAEQYLGMYLVAQRTEEIVKTHEDYVRPEGYNHENCMRIIANAPETIKKAAQLYWDYNKNLVNILEKEGLITKEQAAGLRKYEKYCPMYRDFSADSTMDNELPTITAGRGFINQSSGLKKLKGGSILAVVNPVDSMVHMTSALIARCERNDVAKVMVQAAEDYPGLGSIIVKDPSLSSADASKCAFSVMVNGRKTVYRTTPELYQALQDMSTNSAAFLTNVFGKFTDALRFGATNTPSFMVRNFIRDSISATVNARYGHFIPIVDSVRGMAALKKNADFKAKFYGQGVPMDTYIRSDIRGAKQYKDKVRQSLKRYPMGIRQMMAFARFLVHTYNGVGEALEQGTRAGAMLHALKDGASDFEAGQEARDVTVNFSRHGSLGKKINRYVPFFNASIQGTDKLIRTFMENPKRASLATCIYIILPTIILWAINHDDDWYKELDDNTKYTNWVLHIPGTDHHWLIPKPQEVGIGFGSGVEAALNQMLDKDPHAMKEWARQFTEAVTPGIIATVLRPIMEWRYNYSEWTGRKLVPDRLSKLPPEQQYTTATSELAKLISEFGGKYADLSPIAIDNFFSGWFGSLGRLGAGMLNTPISKLRGNDRPPEPAKYWYEAPFVGSFARQDGQNSVYVERFYQLAHDMEIDYERSDSYAKNKGKKGAPIPASLRDARTCMKTISKINKDIRSIKDDPKMDPDSKRQKIDAANTKMRSFAKKFVTQYDK